MTFLMATAGVAQVASTVSTVITQSVSETAMLFVWGAALLLVGRQLARRSGVVQQQVQPVLPARSRLRASTAHVEVVEVGV